MKKIFYILLALSFVTLSCNKARSFEDNSTSRKANGLEVQADLQSITRSHLGSDGLTLNWDADDKLCLWSTYVCDMSQYDALIEALMEEYGLNAATAEAAVGVEGIYSHHSTRVGDILPLVSGEGSPTGHFRSDILVSNWFNPSATSPYDAYLFMALYPAPATVPEWKYWPQFLDKENYNLIKDYTVQQPYIMVTVPTVQDGKSYWKYQMLLDRGWEERYPGSESSAGLVPQDEIVSGDYRINFSKWEILTSLIEFQMKSTDGEEYTIDHLDITFETGEFDYGVYRDDYYALSGTVPLQLLSDEPHELPLWNQFRLPVNPIVPRADCTWDEMAGATTKVTLQFASPVTIGGDLTSEKYYAVLIPTMCVDNRTSRGFKPHLCFWAYDTDGNMILAKKYSMANEFKFDSTYGHREVYPGLRKGTKYTLDLSLDTVAPFEGGNAGQYEEIFM